jgi:hypothetical protein
MGRLKGSKNKTTLEREMNSQKTHIQPTSNATILNEQFEKSYNSYEEYISSYVEGYVTKLFSDGILKTVSADTLQTWFSNPDTYYKEISDLMTYYYISDGDIYQLYNLIYVLPTLNYKINVFDTSKKYEKNLALLNKIMYKVKYRAITRDLLSQETAKGTVVCMWLGDKKNPYLFIFDNLKYVFPKFRRNGDWVCVVDMEWFKDMKEEERTSSFETLDPFVTKTMFNSYLNNPQTKRYVELPQERTSCLRVNTLLRNQRLGLPMGTQALFDKLHKQSLKNMEVSIANKIIKNVAVVKIGSDKNENYANAKLNPNVKKKIHANVKKALSENIDKGVAVIAVPEYVDIDFGGKNMNGLDGLKKEKFEAVDDSITNATGITKGITNGNGGNFATAKLNLNVIYKRIGVLLEGIEEIYYKLIALVLPSNVADEYYIEFDKTEPLSTKEKTDILMKLNGQGFSVKAVVDLVDGVNYQQYLDQSFYEIETLKLRERIIPPLTSYTITNDSENDGKLGTGAPEVTDPTNENTIVSQENGGNEAPNANI